ncbi:MAG: hypothetical protein U9P73_03040 [Candidatus Cloacimonadota bacterium]|nr:hypothetical protein [Candidatus Cloacimonadota bacterium]
MKEYKTGSSYKYITLFILVLNWIFGALFLSIPIYYFIKDGTIIEDSLIFIYPNVIIYGIIMFVILYQNHRISGIKIKIDSKQIIYTNRRFTKTIVFNDVQKLKLNFFGNRSSIKLFTQTQKVRIYLVFKDAYELLLEIKEGLDISGKSALYSRKKFFKFIRMFLNAEIMLECGIKLIFMFIIGFFLVIISISIKPVSETKLIIAFSSCILSIINYIIPVFIIQNYYKKKSDEESFFFPQRDMEFEKRIVKKGYVVFGLLFAITISIILMT